MALKYFFEYQTKGLKPDNTFDVVTHRCEIYNDSFVGDATEIKGSVTLTKVNDDDVLKSTRGGGLKLDLDASTDLTFSDFYTENERQFSVKYIRNSQLIFYGWLTAEGLFENYVNDKWVISLDCTDGIGFLNNLSYVDNTTKESFTGKQSMIKVIANCLKRTDLAMNIYASINVRYVGLTPPNLLGRTYVNANRFIKDDNNTTMSCEEVLTSILELFAAVITQYNGAWYIYRPNELYVDSEVDFLGYDENGDPLTPFTYTIDLAQTIGSQTDSFYPHHAGANQQLTIKNSIGAYRINYKYGIVKSLFTNIPLINVSGSVDEWTINDVVNLTFPPTNEGFVLATDTTSLLATSNSFNLTSGNIVVFNISFANYQGVAYSKARINARFKLILDDGGGTLYYMAINGSWTTTDTLIEIQSYNQITNNTILSQGLPATGDLYIEIHSPDRFFGATETSDVILYNCNFYPSSDELQDVQGEIFTFQNINNNSTKITENKTVYNGDSPTDVYIGTLYQEDETTPTENWLRSNIPGVQVSRPLLQIMGEERMAMNAKPLRVFSGDVFGYVDFLRVITINNFSQLFMPVEYSYDTANNITKLKLVEILNENNGGDYANIETTSIFDYGETTNPTIKS